MAFSYLNKNWRRGPVINLPLTKDQISRYAPAVFFCGGFVFDVLTLGRIDNILNILSHGLYLLLIMGTLIVQFLEVKPSDEPKWLVGLFFAYQNDIVHFLLGALLNAFVIFYFKSGSLINTFLMLVMLSVLLVINEIKFFKQKGPTLKVVLFTISLASFFIYLLPVLIGRISSLIFMGSQFCTVIIILLLGVLLWLLGVEILQIRAKLLVPSASVIIIFTFLYAVRVIPPVPLSLKQIGIYHNIEKTTDGFILFKQTPPWKFWFQGDQDFVAKEGDVIYLFSRVFAPGGFKDKLFYNFQIKDQHGRWQNTDKIPMTIVGGRDEGFRGYAYKKNYQDGIWRALVETTEGREVGRINFRVSSSTDPSPGVYYQEVY
ncbi:MAG: DUF2914 domain-containing protein [Proteobacteria bacterium]|nr:DUF2914 domain-containing protein [Pseudomonadota bacterium]MBU1713983.1 DUF2914 domain-containing protein [Pseudomonadota bacterium]